MMTLGKFLEERRAELGLRQAELADRAGIPRQTVNRIERGVTKLPEADVRRKLASALGVSHLDLLVASGEISQDEITADGVQGSVIAADDGPEPRLLPLIRQVRWNDERLEAVEGDLRFYIDFDERKGRR